MTGSYSINSSIKYSKIVQVVIVTVICVQHIAN